jgi:hypothetical protein
MTPRRDIEPKGETAAFSIAGTAVGEAATSRGPKLRTRPVQPGRRPDENARLPPPDGARDRAIVMAERRLRGGLEAVVAAIIEAASSGDMAAARLVVDRLLPAPRDRRIALAQRPIARADDAIKASADILAAVARGQITPAEAEAVAKLLHNFIAASEAREFEGRLEALEAASSQRR